MPLKHTCVIRVQSLDGAMKHTMYRLYDTIYTTGTVPDNFRESIMVMLPKKNKTTKCEEYCTLSIQIYMLEIF